MKTTRKLVFSDAFKMAKIIGKTGTKNDIISLMQEGQKKGADIESIGSKFIDILLEKLPYAEIEIYDFLGGLCEKSTEEIAAAEITEIVELFADIIQTNKNLKDFFTLALRSPTAKHSTKS